VGVSRSSEDRSEASEDTGRGRDHCYNLHVHAQVAEDVASSMLRALGDPVRFRLLRELPGEVAAEIPVGELARRLEVSDTVVSQHLRVLSAMGLVGHRRSGRAAYYYVKPEALLAVRQMLANQLPGMFGLEGRLSRLSARNQLIGKVVEVRRGEVSTEICIDIGGQVVSAVITTASADRMDLAMGDVAAAVFKAHDVIVQK
jgi:molybdopterin-binding protein